MYGRDYDPRTNGWYPPTQFGGYPPLPPQQYYPPVTPLQQCYPPMFPPYAGETPGLGFGIASLVCGIVSMLLLVLPTFFGELLTFAVSIICCVLSIVFAVVDRQKRGEFHGVTLSGFIVGLIAASFLLLMVCIFGFAILLAATGGGVA